MSIRIHRVWAFLNLVAGGVLVVVVAVTVASGVASAGDVWVYAFLGMLCIGVGGMLWEPRPGPVTILALPVAAFSGLVAILMLAGGGSWGMSDDWSIDAVKWGATGICLLQLLSVVAAWRGRRRLDEERRVTGPSSGRVAGAPPAQENA